MNIKGIAVSVAPKGVSAAKCEGIIKAALQKIREETFSGASVVYPGFGVFKAKTRAARKGRNPRTGEAIEIQEKTTLVFHDSVK